MGCQRDKPCPLYTTGDFNSGSEGECAGETTDDSRPAIERIYVSRANLGTTPPLTTNAHMSPLNLETSLFLSTNERVSPRNDRRQRS